MIKEANQMPSAAELEDDTEVLTLEEQENERIARAQLMRMDEQSLMMRARKAMLVNLLAMVEKGTAMPADMANLRALLKDNGMVISDPLGPPPTSTRVIEHDDGSEGDLPRLPRYDKPEYEC